MQQQYFEAFADVCYHYMDDFRKVFRCWQTIFFYWFSILTFNMQRDVSQNSNQGWAKNPFFIIQSIFSMI